MIHKIRAIWRIIWASEYYVEAPSGVTYSYKKYNMLEHIRELGLQAELKFGEKDNSIKIDAEK